MQVGDVIQFSHAKESFQVRITSLHHYGNFQEYLEAEGLKDCLPGISTIEDGVDIYHQYYTEKEEYLYGILAIRFQLFY